jgi:NitT/TauT family transport system substrate-binding protein
MWLVSARDWARCGGAAGRPRRRVAGVTAAAAGLVLVAGCHVLGTSSAAGPTGSGTVTVAAAPGVGDAPIYIGIKDGLFRQAGINVRVVAFGSVSAEVAALKAGKVDVAFGDYADFFYAQQVKPSPDLKIVANGYDAAPGVMEVLTRPGSKITSAADLAGKTIGTARPQEMSYSTKRPYSEETVATWSVLSSDNVVPTSIRWQTMPSNELVTKLQNGQVDAILATEPTIYAAESQLGAVPVLDACTGATANLPLDGYFSDATYAKKNAANLAAFRAALLKAQGDAAMAAPVQSALQHYAGLQVETSTLVTLGSYPIALQARDLQRVANIMFNFNAEPAGTGTLSVSSMVLHG